MSLFSFLAPDLLLCVDRDALAGDAVVLRGPLSAQVRLSVPGLTRKTRLEPACCGRCSAAGSLLRGYAVAGGRLAGSGGLVMIAFSFLFLFDTFLASPFPFKFYFSFSRVPLLFNILVSGVDASLALLPCNGNKMKR